MLSRRWLFLASILLATLPVVLYLVNFRWGGGDSFSYLNGYIRFFSTGFVDSYSLSGALFAPFLLVSGLNPDSLVYASVLYRLFFVSLANAASDSRVLSVALASFLISPFHTLLSLFPGKDVFSFGFFIIYLFVICGYGRFWLSFLIAIFCAAFRPMLGFFMLASSAFIIVYRVLKGSSNFRGTLPVLLMIASVPVVGPRFAELFFRSDISSVQDRIMIDLQQGYFNVVGYEDFPLSLLNILYPLISPSPLSVYSLLSIENGVSLYFIFLFVFNRRSLAFGRHSQLAVLNLKICFSMIFLYALIFTALWPNITDAARKTYPLNFCGAAALVFLKNDKKVAGFDAYSGGN